MSPSPLPPYHSSAIYSLQAHLMRASTPPPLPSLHEPPPADSKCLWLMSAPPPTRCVTRPDTVREMGKRPASIGFAAAKDLSSTCSTSSALALSWVAIARTSRAVAPDAACVCEADPVRLGCGPRCAPCELRASQVRAAA